MEKKKNKPKLRARGYSRTSGEKQRDNTSIPTQKAEIEKYIANDDERVFTGHYVDECKSGAKVEGRDDFKQMMKDAANREFDILVIFDIDRFGRNGREIINNAYLLKDNFGVHVVDTKGKYDNRDYKRNFTNTVYAGLSEQDRLGIIDRCYRGRKATAAKGGKWCNVEPFGRKWDADNKKFIISEDGRKLQKLLPRYADGESLRDLAIEYGFKSAQRITRTIRESQLSGTYYATFNAPDIGVIDEKVEVPGMPKIVPPAMMKRVRDRLAHNTRWNKQSKKKYLLSGFVRCTHCGRALKSQTQTSGQGNIAKKIHYYRHYYKSYYVDGRDKQSKCTAFRSIRADQLEGPVMDYLFGWFVDKPAFECSVKNTFPDEEDRKAAEQDIESTKKQLARLDREELKLVNALNGGLKKTDVIIAEQEKIIEQRAGLQKRLNDLQQTRDSMPDQEQVVTEASLLRLTLLSQHLGKDWRSMSYEQIRKFLHFLFSDNPKKYGYGIFVGREKCQWVISFEGNMQFYHDIKNKQPEFVNDLTAAQKDYINIQNECRYMLKEGFAEVKEQRIQAEKEYERQARKAKRELKKMGIKSNIKPNTPNS